MTKPYIVVPALTPVQDGEVDEDALNHYASRAARTWVDAYLLSGSTTRGDLLNVEQRARVVELWLRHLSAERLIACCWNSTDVTLAGTHRVAPMVVMRDLADRAAALRLFASLPPHGFIYSHPMYTQTTYDPALAAAAAAQGLSPAGGKIAKVSARQITELRSAAGPAFAIWDGSSRDIARSISAGARGVIATPLSYLPDPFPTFDLAVLQPVIGQIQAALDSLPDRPARSALLARLAFEPKTGLSKGF